MTAQEKRPSPPLAGGAPSESSWKARLSRPGCICALLAALTLAAYLPTAWNDFVNYDDSDYVTENAHVKSGLTWETAVWAFRTGHASNWHPLTWLSHALDCQAFGVKPGAMHLVSVALHVANTVLLLLVLRALTGALWRSALVAALFGLHPLHVESVAWVSERKDVLSTLFFLLTIWAYGCYAKGRSSTSEVRERKPRGAAAATLRGMGSVDAGGASFQLPSSAFYLLSVLSLALGLMSKPMLVTTPFVLLLLDYWPLGRLQRETQDARLKTVFALLLEKLPFFALSAASSVVTFRVQREGGAVSTALTVGERIANAVVSYARYIRKTFWPDDLSVLYPHPGHWPPWQVLACAALLVGVCVVVAMLGRRRPYLVVGWLWFLGTMVPVIGLVQVGIQSMADRYTYVPLIGLFIMVVWAVRDLVVERLPETWQGRTFALAAAVALAACTGLTVRQVQFWRDTEALFKRAVRVTRNNYLAHNNLGFYYSGKGRKAEAMQEYHLSLQINPAYEDALNNLGYALAGERKFAEAIPLYEAALRVRPKHAEVNNNLGNALSETGRIDEAIQHYLIALQQNPEHADAHNNLGIALAMQGKLDQAIPHFQAAIRYKPDYASAHSNLGNALAAEHKLDEAIKEYQTSLRLKPDDAQAHNNLGNALMEQGQVKEAVHQYEAALRLNPDNNPEAHYNLALALARQGKRQEAIKHLTEALRAKPDYPDAKRELGLLSAPSQR
jgi:tetratricopeptide (TPR) repeat protein